MSEGVGLERVKQLMSEVGIGFLATTDGSKAAVRPMSAWLWDGPDLICATWRNSDKVAEIGKCAAGEYCFMNKDWAHVRICGALIMEDGPELKRRLYESHAPLQGLFEGPDDPRLVYLRMKVERVRFMDQETTYEDIAVD